MRPYCICSLLACSCPLPNSLTSLNWVSDTALDEMRLLNARTLQLEEFNDEKTRPPYGILSHTWGADEITLQDLLWLQELGGWEDDEPTPRELRKRDRLKASAGYEKIASAALQSLQDGLEYVWVDTCCIDKTSSAELSEAINSMYKWYEDSRVCYAYLSDVVPDQDFPGYAATTLTVPEDRELRLQRRGQLRARAMERIKRSRWFTRGWTLQELLAPAAVFFLSRDWKDIGFKRTGRSAKGKPLRSAWAHGEPLELNSCIYQITKIPEAILFHTKNMRFEPIALRFSWARSRNTTRKEDLAYCLLGIFGVHMPLLYGEGDRAFVRLQEEILKQSEDSTLLCWDLDSQILSESGSLFATCPSQFSGFCDLRLTHSFDLNERECFMHLINNGLRIRVTVGVIHSTTLIPRSSCPFGLSQRTFYAVFPPTFEAYKTKVSELRATYFIGLPLASTDNWAIQPDVMNLVDGMQLWKPVGGAPVRINHRAVSEMTNVMEIVIRRDVPQFASHLHSKNQTLEWQTWCWRHLKVPFQERPFSADSYFVISLASFPRLQNRRLQILEVFPPDRWRPTSRTIVFGTFLAPHIVHDTNVPGEIVTRDQGLFEDSVFIRFGTDYRNPEQCCIVEILREVSWEGGSHIGNRLGVYSNAGSMWPYLSLADAFLSGESREVVRNGYSNRPPIELPFELRKHPRRDAMAVLHFGGVKESSNDFGEFPVVEPEDAEEGKP